MELQHLVAGESDALRKENFELFCGLMRLSYNDRHLELVTWAEEAAQLSREQQRAFLRDASRLLRESYMLHAGINEIIETIPFGERCRNRRFRGLRPSVL